jgi:hypothetical protein
LEAARVRHGFRLVIRDVDSDPAWTEAHGEHVPVVAVDGKIRFRGRVNEVLLERLLTGLTATEDARSRKRPEADS